MIYQGVCHFHEMDEILRTNVSMKVKKFGGGRRAKCQIPIRVFVCLINLCE